MTEQKIKKRKVLRNNEYYGQQEILDDLYNKSSKGRYFDKLYELIISEDNIMKAYRTIKRNTGSKTKGVNGHTIKYLERLSKDKLINIVRQRLSYYKPNPVRRVFIPKSNGKQRPLGIPTIEDRLIQQCILQILEPICEGKFHKSSFGFRPNRSTHHAIARCQHLINHSKNHFVVDMDIKGLFDNVNHIITEKGRKNEVFKTFYKGYSGSLDRCCSITIYPIPFIHFKKPLQIHPEVTPYTEIGRNRIHNTLTVVSPQELEALRRGNFGKRSVEYVDNRISKFVGQNGKCYISGMRLYTDEVHCHHKIPLKLGGTDKYDNLIIVHKDIHKLIHSTNIKLILQSSKDWTVKSKSKFNQLRKEANLELIDFKLVA